MPNLKPLILIISRNYSTGLGVIRALGMKGYTIDLIANAKRKGSSKIASCSKYVRKSVEVLVPNILEDNGDKIIAQIMKYEDEASKTPVVLFPVDDYAVSVLDCHKESLNKHFIMPRFCESSQFSFFESMDKNLQSTLANEAEIRIPKEWIIDLRTEIEVPTDMIYPCFVKPLDSVSGYKTEMRRCDNQEELEKYLEHLRKRASNRSILVQEFLFIDKEFNLSGVCLDQEVIIPAVIEKTRISRHETGVAITGKIVSADVLGEVKGKIETLLKKFRYIGMFDIDLSFCKGEFYFNEINFRSGGSNYAFYAAGVNLPEIFIKEILNLGHSKEEEIIRNFGVSFVYEKVAWEDYIYKAISKDELKDCIYNVDLTLLANEDDPRPGKVFNRRIRLSLVKNRVKGFLSRGQTSEDNYLKVKENGTVLLIGRNYSNLLAMARAFGEGGYKVEILRVFKKKPSMINLLSKMKPEAMSKYVKEYKQCIVNGELEKLLFSLKEFSAENDKKLLVPVDDYTVSFVDNNLGVLSESYVLPNIDNKQGKVDELLDKGLQKTLAENCGLSVLPSVTIISEDGKYEIPDNIEFPCFVKPNVSMKLTKAWMSKCESAEALDDLMAIYAKKGDFEVIVETFADIKTEYSILGLSQNQRIISPGIFKAIQGGHKERKGVALTGTLVNDLRLQKFAEKCNDFLSTLHFTGIFDIDLIETVSGELYFIEINMRPGASTNILMKYGINLPKMFADYMLKNDNSQSIAMFDCDNKIFISEKILIEEYTRNDKSWRDVRKDMRDSEIFLIKDAEDRKPYKYFRRFYIVAALMKIPYFIRDIRRDNGQ